MNLNLHPFCRYGLAVLLEEFNKDSISDVTLDDIKNCIRIGLNHFSVKPDGEIGGSETVKYMFVGIMNKASEFIYLSPNVISSEKEARYIYKSANDFLNIEPKTSKKNIVTDDNQAVLSQNSDITKSEMPISGEFSTFNASIGRGKPKVTILEKGLAIIASLTVSKPSLQYKLPKKGKSDTYNVCIIPDLPLDQMRLFVRVFKKMYIQKTSDLMIGRVFANVEKGVTAYRPERPKIFNGNFPNAPRKSIMASVALLGAIGEFAKEAEESESKMALAVLDALKTCRIYMIKYGDASVFTFNHFVVDLAKDAELNNIIKDIFKAELYKEVKSIGDKEFEYQPFYLFASRFLQLFSKESFKDFFAYRAEYPMNMNILFDKYFINMEHISKEIVDSVRSLGAWLNRVAFIASKDEADVKKAKAKVLAEMESTIFAAKSADALLSQVVIRAGRLSNTDAPSEAALFMEKVATGDVPLSTAKNLITAYSRLRSYTFNNVEGESAGDAAQTDIEEEIENLSNI